MKEEKEENIKTKTSEMLVDLKTETGYKYEIESEKSEKFFENKIVSLSERKMRGTHKIKPLPEFVMDTDWLSTLEAASYMRLLSRDGKPCVNSLRNLVCQGRIPHYKPFGRLLFRRSELHRFIESSRKGGFVCR